MIITSKKKHFFRFWLFIFATETPYVMLFNSKVKPVHKLLLSDYTAFTPPLQGELDSWGKRGNYAY